MNIREKLETMQVYPMFKDIIAELLNRRAIVFEENDADIEANISRVIENVCEIKQYENSMQDDLSIGNFYGPTKSIKLNLRGIRKIKRKDELLGVFAHEIFHAITYNQNEAKDDLTSEKNEMMYSMLEQIVAKSSNCTVNNRIPENVYYNNNAVGYTQSVWGLDILAAIYGVREIDLLKHSIKSRDVLCEYLSNVSNEPIDDTSNFVNEFEEKYEELYHLNLPKTNNQIIKGVDARFNAYSSFIKSFNELCLTKFLHTVENTSIDSKFLAYNYNKYNVILKNFFDKVNDAGEIHNVKLDDNILNPSIKKEIKNTIQEKTNLNIVPENGLFELDENYLKEQKDAETIISNWDNKKLNRKLKQAITLIKIRSIIDKFDNHLVDDVKGAFGDFKKLFIKKEIKKLDEPKVIITEKNVNPWALKPKELEEYNKRVKQSKDEKNKDYQFKNEKVKDENDGPSI